MRIACVLRIAMTSAVARCHPASDASAPQASNLRLFAGYSPTVVEGVDLSACGDPEVAAAIEVIPGLLLWLPPSVYAQLAPPNEAGVSMGHVHLNVANLEVHQKL